REQLRGKREIKSTLLRLEKRPGVCEKANHFNDNKGLPFLKKRNNTILKKLKTMSVYAIEQRMFGRTCELFIFFFLAKEENENIKNFIKKKKLGETIGSLLNATFGNAVEIVMMILALVKAKNFQNNNETDNRDTLVHVVQLSLIGSIFSNSLLVFGCAFLAAGYKQDATLNIAATSANVSLLLLASFVMILSAPYDGLFLLCCSNTNFFFLFFCKGKESNVGFCLTPFFFFVSSHFFKVVMLCTIQKDILQVYATITLRTMTRQNGFAFAILNV
ncbi:hypothetical protein RFI_30913, partial [Reticulomyxa filosa]